MKFKTFTKIILFIVILNFASCNQDEDIYEASKVEEQQTEEKLPTYDEVMKNGGVLMNPKESNRVSIPYHSIYSYDVTYKHYMTKEDLEEHSKHSIQHLFDYIKKINNGTECAYITLNNKVIHNPKSQKGYYWGQYWLNGKEYRPYYNDIYHWMRWNKQYFYLPKGRVKYNYHSSTSHTDPIPISSTSYENCTSSMAISTLSFTEQIGISKTTSRSTSSGSSNATKWAGKVSAGIGIPEFMKKLLPSLNIETSFEKSETVNFEERTENSQTTNAYRSFTDSFTLRYENAKGWMFVYRTYAKHKYKTWAGIAATGNITYSLLEKNPNVWSSDWSDQFDLKDGQIHLNDYYRYLGTSNSQSKLLGYVEFQAPTGTKHVNQQERKCYN
ncbi:hypothetical protein [Tenacibaculum xiamenense]|uniref:hypothetical protein n=1 Tax=Tenacibaculum xiamenense TaxID=1261553 RepID=UPI00389614EE